MDRLEEESHSFTESDLMDAYFSLFSRSVEISKPVHIMKFDSLISKFLTDFLELSEKIRNEIKQNKTAKENVQKYYLHVFGGSLKT